MEPDEAAAQMEGLFATEEAQPETTTEPTTETTEASTQETTEETTDDTTEESTAKVEGDDATEDATEETTDDDSGMETLSELIDFLETDSDTLMNLKAKAKVDGVEQDVSLRDLVKSYQLEGHVNKKSIELSNERKRMDAEFAESAQAYQAQMENLNGLSEQLSQLVTQDKEVNWPELRENDPIEYVRLKEEARERTDALNQVKAAQEQQNQQQQFEQKKQYDATVNDERGKLIDAIPEWSDETVATKERNALQDYLANTGFSTEEVNGIIDHRAVILSRKAMLYDQLQKGKTVARKKVKSLPKVQKPGAASTSADVDNDKKSALKSRFAKSGSIDDLAELFLT